MITNAVNSFQTSADFVCSHDDHPYGYPTVRTCKANLERAWQKANGLVICYLDPDGLLFISQTQFVNDILVYRSVEVVLSVVAVKFWI